VQRKQSTEYQAKDYTSLIGMPGFSEQQLKMHFQLYQGYVRNTNLLLTRMKELELQDRDQTIDYAALKRRLGWEWDGMRLHEYYFENLGGNTPLDKSSALNQAMTREFGSFEAWKKNFIATGMIRGIGWSVLYRDRHTGRIFNVWINEHDLGHLAGGDLLLVMDVFEHAYITQYGLDRGRYIQAFFDNVNWEKVSKRYQDSLRTSSMQ
jgi:Fe-Mn family superoxide dismutase